MRSLSIGSRIDPLHPQSSPQLRTDEEEGRDDEKRRDPEIRREGEDWVLVDVGSRNGTLLNGKKIDGEVELSAGDELARLIRDFLERKALAVHEAAA